ncbi:hypothetical protein VI817_007302 [Penicillium citrinum]|nr:hypothetical protein VI817_007302 [Penicillium citrinum]
MAQSGDAVSARGALILAPSKTHKGEVLLGREGGNTGVAAESLVRARECRQRERENSEKLLGMHSERFAQSRGNR